MEMAEEQEPSESKPHSTLKATALTTNIPLAKTNSMVKLNTNGTGLMIRPGWERGQRFSEQIPKLSR